MTAYRGTSLEIDVTRTGGSGTYGALVLAAPAATVLINNAANDWNRAMVDLIEDPAASVEVCGIRFKSGTNRLDAGHPYPVPRQVGQGHDGKGSILDPLYIWNCGNPAIGMNDYEPDEVGRDLHTADYIKQGRDYQVGVAKPGYAKYAYPHPLRAASPSPP